MADAPEVVPSTEVKDSKYAQDAVPTYSSADTATSTLIGSAKGSTPKAEDSGLQKADNTTPKYFVEQQPFSSESIAPVSSPQQTPAQELGSSRAMDYGQAAQANDDDWNYKLSDCCTPGSLGFEAVTCPCILAGRTHGRINDVPPEKLTSTNGYCCGWASLYIFCVACMGCYWIMGMATRREIRYRYGIKGTNCGDCWRSAFCCCCALVQEEKEVLLREERKRNAAANTEGYIVREQGMNYGGSP